MPRTRRANPPTPAAAPAPAIGRPPLPILGHVTGMHHEGRRTYITIMTSMGFEARVKISNGELADLIVSTVRRFR